MTQLAKAYWTIDGTPFPRNPDNWTAKYDNANLTYVPMASGRVRRVKASNKLASMPITLEWHYADWRVRGFVLQQFGNDIAHQIEIAGELPRKVLYAYFDTPDVGMSKEAYDTRDGQGNMRRDIKVTGRADEPYVKSFYNVPLATPTSTQMQTWFGGPLGIPALDYLPAWNGNGYNYQTTTGVTRAITNMGNAPWTPTIRFNGPFNTGLTLNVAYLDVDGTGAGVTFTYTGPNVASGDYITFDTKRLRAYASISSAISEIYTFTVTAVSSGLPFAYWPPAPTGNFSYTLGGVAGATSGHTSIDYSNNGTEVFRYYP